MRILLTNDDGIHAPGLRALYDGLKDLGELAVSAPERQASAASHSISLHQPFRVTRDAWPGIPHTYAVSSSPADCVRLAVLKLLPFKPDLVVSGINQGANYGTLVLYSGTVAAAAEGVVLDVPAIAVSVAGHHHKDFAPAAAAANRMARYVAEKGLPPGVLLNINVPPVPASELKGLVLAHQGRFRHVDDLEEHGELDDHFGYILDSPVHPETEDPDSDVERVKAGYVSVTPLHLDLTARPYWSRFAEGPWGELPWKR